jgi:hypothetical protein
MKNTFENDFLFKFYYEYNFKSCSIWKPNCIKKRSWILMWKMNAQRKKFYVCNMRDFFNHDHTLRMHFWGIFSCIVISRSISNAFLFVFFNRYLIEGVSI